MHTCNAWERSRQKRLNYAPFPSVPGLLTLNSAAHSNSSTMDFIVGLAAHLIVYVSFAVLAT